jgi:hypothetical protein
MNNDYGAGIHVHIRYLMAGYLIKPEIRNEDDTGHPASFAFVPSDFRFTRTSVSRVQENRRSRSKILEGPCCASKVGLLLLPGARE